MISNQDFSKYMKISFLKLSIFRPDKSLDYWNKENFYEDYRKIEEGSKMYEHLNSETLNIPRVHCDDLSVEEFYEKYQKPNLPVVIEGLADNWPAMEKWTFNTLYKEYGDVQFEVGEDQDGNSVKVPLKEYIQYMVFNQDDSPFYLFQRNLHRDESLK